MLTQLTELLTSKESGLSLAEISRALGAQPSAVMSMLGLLVQKGRLVEIGPDGGQCAKCGAQSDCNLLAARGKRYALAASQQSPMLPVVGCQKSGDF
ncbi:MAG: FeoC-like transcriptional regulator [Chloroflexota bacterium]